jgi:hypothetical protein
MAKTYTCACGATFATEAQLQQHAATCGMAREPGGEPASND